MNNRTFHIKYSIKDKLEDEYFIEYDGPDDYELIKESAIHEIKKHLNKSVSGRIIIDEISEYNQ